MKFFTKIGAVIGSLVAINAVAHPGHTHDWQNSFHMVTNNMVVVAIIVGILLSLRALTSRK